MHNASETDFGRGMHMTEAVGLPDGAGRIGHRPHPDRIWCKGAATPNFIVHGHRHACLYRMNISTLIPFIVLKICKKLRVGSEHGSAYFWNNEA